MVFIMLKVLLVLASASALKLKFISTPGSVSPSQVTAGTTLSTVQVRLVEDDGTTYAYSPDSRIALGVDTGQLSGTVNAMTSNGNAYFTDLKLDTPGTVYLYAFSSDYEPVASSSITVSNGSASKLAFTAASATQTIGTSSSYTVQVQDVAENLNSGSSASILLSVIGSVNGAAIVGSNPVSASSGSASFSIYIDQPGTFQLVASSSSLTSATSTYITVSQGSQPSSVTASGSTAVIVGEEFTVAAKLYSGSSLFSTARDIEASATGLSGTLTTTTSGGSASLSSLYFTSSGSKTLTVKCPSSSCGTDITTSYTVTVTYGSYITIEPATQQPEALESSTYTYTVKLKSKPQSDVTVSVSSGNGSVTSSPASLTFTSADYSTAQTVTLTVGSGIVASGSFFEAVSITHSASSTDTAYDSSNVAYEGCDKVSSAGVLTLNVIGTLPTSEVVLSTTTLVISSSTLTSTFSMFLRTAPSLTVTINLFPSGITLSSASLEFTTANYATPQTVTVTASANYNPNGYSLYNIETSITTSDTAYSNAMIPSLEVVVLSSGTSAAVTVSAYPVVNEGSTTSYTLALVNQPSDSVTINLSVSSGYISVSPTSLTFTTGNYASTQSVTVSVVSGTTPRSMVYTAYITHDVVTDDLSYQVAPFSRDNPLPVTVRNICSPGEYTATPGSGTCTTCPSDSYCPYPYDTKYPCSTGQVSGKLFCFDCPTDGDCASCASGNYMEADGTCTTCPANYACANSQKFACPVGTYSASGASTCTSCPQGYMCPTTGKEACSPGTYSLGFEGACHNCPPGFQCSNGYSPVACDVGYFAPTGSNYCSACPAGSYCSREAILGTCADGTYSDEGFGQCVICPAGYYCTGGLKAACSDPQYSMAGQYACYTCPTGYLCQNGVLPVACLPDSTGGTSSCTACSSGQYLDGTCKSCPAGFYCPKIAQPPLPCHLGTYSNAGAASCTVCNAGTLCSYGSTTASPNTSCPPGFYCESTTVGAYTVILITSCSAGTYLNSEGNGSSSSCAACTAGYYCPRGTRDPKEFLCPPGHYCPSSSSVPTACADGTYSPDWGLSSNTCSTCPAGYFCPSGTIEPHACRPGYYCTSGQSAGTACNSGTYSPDIYATDSSTCRTCPAGYYCPSGSFRPTPCSIGTYSSSTGISSSSCTACPAGYSCPYLAMTINGVPCWPGHYCPSSTTFPNSNPCSTGKYTDRTDASASTDCTNCPAAWACVTAGTSEARIPKVHCTEGYYCPGSSAVASDNPCPAGTYSNLRYLSGQSDCTDCPAGSSCVSASVRPDYCKAGHYCPAKTTAADSNPCPAGTYSNSKSLKASSECTPCPKGYYCTSGSTAPSACPDGTYNPSINGQANSSTYCIPCPAGNYCLTAFVNPEPCGKGYYSSASSTSCTVCDAGRYCPNEVNTDTDHTNNLCPAGLYCPSGTDHIPTNLNDRCSKGYYCTQGTTTETACSSGKIRSIPGGASASDCVDADSGTFVSSSGQSAVEGYCSPGYYCPSGSTSSTATPCDAGSFRRLSGGRSQSDCAVCPAGYYCGSGTSVPTICPAGKYCAESTSTPASCPAGTYFPNTGATRESDCYECTPGYYCATSGLTSVTGQCTAGYYCTGGATTATQTTCPTGGYCIAGTVDPISCPVGKYNPSSGQVDSSACVACTAGYYCLGNTATPSLTCKAGFYCTGGSATDSQYSATPGHYTSSGASSEANCLAGTYQPSSAQSSCLSCPAGFYCPTAAMTTPTICPTGSYCPSNASSATPCSSGTYNPYEGMKSSSDCLDCAPGYYCPTTGLSDISSNSCTAGYYCKTQATTNTPSTEDTDKKFGPCPAGYYCPTKTSFPIPCRPGKFSASTGTSATASTVCSSCTAGSYCETAGQTAVTGSCSAGFYCVAGTKVSTPSSGLCSAGKYCASGSSVETSCVAGNYQPNQGQTSCISCPKGYYCPTETSDYTSNKCDKGYYCDASSTNSKQTACTAGYYNPTDYAFDSSFCVPCDSGSYCELPGLSAPTASCSAGWYCEEQSSVSQPASGSTYGGQCAAGSYCPSGSTAPKQCEPGYYCVGGQSTMSGQCTGGYYCGASETSATPTDKQCTEGYYCPTGSAAMTACPAGKYNNVVGQDELTDCLTCPASYFCEAATTINPTGNSSNECNAGWYCPSGSKTGKPEGTGCTAGHKCPTNSSVETECPAGTYQPQVLMDSCLNCDAGYYCTGPAATSAVICPAGYYCPTSTSDYTLYPCPAGKYNPIKGASSSSACLDCLPGKYCSGTGKSTYTGDCQQGYYCPGANTSATGTTCSAGNYCPTGSTSPIPCPGGKACTTSGLSAPDATCTAGYYCSRSSTSVTATICTTGHYCEAGSASPTPCPLGKYNPTTGKSASTDCISCTAGSYCDTMGASAVTGQCTAGYYCPAGSIEATPKGSVCSAGTFCVAGSTGETSCPAGTYGYLIGQAACLTCPSGFKCAGGTSDPDLCDAGYYCPSGTTPTTQVACTAGTFNKFTGQTACRTCPAGFYCLSGATDPTTCPSGSYCPEGSATATPCDDGTYSEVLGLQQSSNCKPCPAGSYCTGGSITGKCLAGYYCISGITVNNPDGTQATGSGMLCPLGHYCVSGTTIPTPCPFGLFTDSTGKSLESDCKPCTPGYYCIPGDPTLYPCPPGAYCPSGSQTPTNCPVKTHNALEKGTSSAICVACAAGYLCTETGVGFYERFPCSPGYYCPVGSTTTVQCPAGRWSPVHNAGSSSGCRSCPSGSYCTEGSNSYMPCSRGRWCPQESTSESNYCPDGYFCDHNTTALESCPAGFFCPAYNTTMTEYPPWRCSQGTYCPLQSALPTNCPVGYIGLYYSERKSMYEGCKPCGDGYWADLSTNTCYLCYAGYACPGGASRPDPTDLDLYGGYVCPTGYYCPEGTGYPNVCPVGTYNKFVGATSAEDCLPCDIDTFQDIEGQAGCFKCGPTATASTGQITCSCNGDNRAYMKRDGTCRCQPGYEFFKNGLDNSDFDSDEGCIPIVRDICVAGQIRTEGGKCSSDTSCGECTYGGKKDPDTGTCFCDSEPTIYEVCNADCRANTPTVTLNSDGMFEVLYPGKSVPETVDYQSTDGYLGRIYCDSGLSCGISTVEMSEDGIFRSNYQPNAVLNQTSTSRRRMQSTTDYLTSPVYCLNLGETMVFSISSTDHYPVYKKDSLLISNSSADFGPFLELKSLMEEGSNITSFAYTFRDTGTFVFADSSNSDQITIVKVVNEFASCSEPKIRERSPAALTSTGVTQDTDITTEADWAMIGLVLSFIFAFLLFLACIFYFHRRIGKQQHKARLQKIKDQLEVNSKLIELGNDDILADTSSFFKPRADINPQLFYDIYSQLEDNYGALKKQLDNKDKLDNTQLQALQTATESLKDTVNQLLRGKKPDFSDDPFIIEAKPQEDAPEQLLRVTTNELGSKMRHLDPEQKKQLMQEMDEQRLKLQAQLSEERVSAQQNLKGRLEERARRRRELMDEKQRLKEREEELSLQISRTQKEADKFIREADREFDIEMRKAKEKIIGKPAKDLKKRFKDAVLQDPEREAELLRKYEQDLLLLEGTLDDNKRRQVSELERRLEERRAQRQAQARARLRNTEATSDELNRMRKQIDKVDKQLAVLESIDQGSQSANLAAENQGQVGLPSGNVLQNATDSSLTFAEEASISKKYDIVADESIRNHESTLQSLQAQRQKIAQSLSSATDNQRADLLRMLDDIDSQIDKMKDQQMSRQKQLLEERLQERRRLREMKRMQAERDAERAQAEQVSSQDQISQIEDLINSLPKNEKLDVARNILADKHDKELLTMQRAQQEQASRLQADHLKEKIEEKAVAMRVIREQLGSELDSEEQKRLVDSMLGQPDTDFEQRWQAYKKRCNDDLLELLEKQLEEMNGLMRRLGLDNDPELTQKRSELEGDFEQRKREMEEYAQMQNEALNRKQEELQVKKQAQLADIAATQERLRKQTEVEQARRELELKQRIEREKLERQGNMTRKQIDDLIKIHENQIAQLEQAMMTEKERQQEAVRQKLKAKREQQQKLLDLPADMRSLAPATVSLLQQWRRGYHTETVELSDDLLGELLARVLRIEKIVKNVDATQFQETMAALNEARSLLAQYY